MIFCDAWKEQGIKHATHGVLPQVTNLMSLVMHDMVGVEEMVLPTTTCMVDAIRWHT